MNSQEFALSVAALRRDGEEDDGQPYEMSLDVAFDTLARIIREAREIVKTAAEKLEPPIDTSKSAVANIAAVLSTAADRSQAGPVAQHLVGAKLALRYPEMEIENHSYSTAAAPLNRQGDFVVNDTAFHVTVTPTPALLEKCEWNLRQGYRPVVLVPDRKREGTLQVAESLGLQERVEVLAIESFVGQNIEELSRFGQAAFGENMRKLFEVYNQRV